jgi:tetratricopeptide (TPR) repeat protein
MNNPLCFVLMPFGKKSVAAGAEIDFDAVYNNLIAPAVEAAELEPIRADNEAVGGIIHKPMYERLILCDYAIADLTTANANVFYELGLRHAARPRSTILIFSKDGKQLPFDVGPLRAIPYDLGPDGTPTNVETTKKMLVDSLLNARKAVAEGAATDSPVFQLVEGYPTNVAHAKTDIFRDQVQYAIEKKKELAAARKQGVAALRTCEQQLGALADVEAGVVIDLFLSYRSVKAWDDMIALANKMPGPLAATAMVQEQLALALNRAGRGEEAEQVLKDLLERRGPSSETYGILGRVYKDRWEAALKAGDQFLAEGLLDQAIEAYRQGFEADWRDAYPGVNAVTLMELKEPPDPQRTRLIPVVAYAVDRRIAAGKPDYWDYATRLELAVLEKDGQAANAALRAALPLIREVWEPETTVRNLRLIREARERRNEQEPWMLTIEQVLTSRTRK